MRHCDTDGFWFVTGRLKELIIKGGENIAPREIDEVLLQHPAILEAAAAVQDVSPLHPAGGAAQGPVGQGAAAAHRRLNLAAGGIASLC